jgi:hypothetical protein
MMKNITWSAGESTDKDLLKIIPVELREIIEPSGGFILHHGAIHFRGCTAEPKWNSLREALGGESAFKSLYPDLLDSDIPFAQDQFGDQFILRDSKVYTLEAETGDISKFSESITKFMQGIENDIEEFLNIGLDHILEPGQLLHAYPPFCTKESEDGVSLKPIPTFELIEFHADFAKQIKAIPDGGQFEVKLTE